MKFDRSYFKDTLGWGFLLWLFGYVLGMLLFAFVPTALLGWIITPVATVITIWVLYKKIASPSFGYSLHVAILWTFIAMIMDYLFIVKAFHPEDGYYKADIFIYYGLTFFLPIIVGFLKRNKNK
ncbi:MAG: hypothetical protein KG003_03950 [Bacteroidetes bacterium]|nr:hypothetical protein [Bacteroidota bacterium]